MKKKPKADPLEGEIKGVADEVAQLLKKHGLGMQAVIQIFKIPESPIVAQGNAEDIADILKAQGDKIENGTESV